MAMPKVKYTVRGYKFNHFAINSTVAVAAEARINPALPATAVLSGIYGQVVEFVSAHGKATTVFLHYSNNLYAAISCSADYNGITETKM